MRFETVIPAERLQPYIKQLVISENATQHTYKVFPSAAIVMGFQYSGTLYVVGNNTTTPLSSAGITGLSDSYKQFTNSANIGTILVYFTELGLAHFTTIPVNQLFGQSVSLDHLFNKDKVSETEEKLNHATTDRQRIRIVEQFLLSQIKSIQTDKLVIEAVKAIYQSKGTIAISELAKQLCTSQSPLEKRFRKIVGATPKKFASIIRFDAILNGLESNNRSLTGICYDNNFFDQAHFIKEFRRFTGQTPEQFKQQQ